MQSQEQILRAIHQLKGEVQSLEERKKHVQQQIDLSNDIISGYERLLQAFELSASLHNALETVTP